MPKRDRRAALAAAMLAGTLALAACNGQSPPAKVGSGAGQTDNTGAASGRVTTQEDAQKSGGNP